MVFFKGISAAISPTIAPQPLSPTRSPTLTSSPTISAATYSPAQATQHANANAGFSAAPNNVISSSAGASRDGLAMFANPSTNANAANMAAFTQAVNPDSLTSNRLNALLNNNSQYMQLARSQGLQQSNRRGLLNSSMAVGSSQQAAIASGLPIAQADAASFGRQSLTNQQYLNSANQQNAQMQQQAELQNAAAANAVNQQNAQIGTRVSLQNASNANQMNQFNASQANTVAAANAARSVQNQQFNTNQSNAMGRFNSQATDAVNQVNVNAANAAASTNAQQANAVNQGNQNVAAKFDLQNQQSITQLQRDASSNQASIMDRYMQAYNAIQIDPKLSVEAKTTALEGMRNQAIRATKGLASINGAAANLTAITWA